MRLSTNIVFTVVVMHMHYHLACTQEDYDESCVNPDGQLGNCKSLQLCEPFLQLLRQYGSGVKDFLQKSICGFDDYDSRVCCPDVDTSLPSDNRNNNNNNQYGPLVAPQCGISSPRPPVKSFIIGGWPVSLGQWPWLAVLGYKNKRDPDDPSWLCGGSLISRRHVLTAAHCVHGRNDLYLVRLGEHELDKSYDVASPIDVGIQKFSIHPQYNSQTFTNDLAILKLQQDVEFTESIRAICLPVIESLRQKSFVNTFPYMAGWGAFFFTGPRSTILQQVQVPIVSELECKQAFKKFQNVTIDGRVACAGFAQGGKGACQGDSGGPLMVKEGEAFYAIAVISYGYKCATPGIPGVFTRTSAFLDFILPLLN